MADTLMFPQYSKGILRFPITPIIGHNDVANDLDVGDMNCFWTE